MFALNLKMQRDYRFQYPCTSCIDALCARRNLSALQEIGRVIRLLFIPRLLLTLQIMFAAKNVFNTIAQKSLKLSETTWRGTQPAWLISCDKLELVLTKHGLNIASVTHIDDANKLNPFWVPKWPWSSPIENRHLHIKGQAEEIYGNREDSQLLTNICGHSLCIDRFGICKLTDEPRTCHGEAAGIIPLKVLTISAFLCQTTVHSE